MPEHTSFLSYLIAMFPALGQNVANLPPSVTGKHMSAHSVEPLTASLMVFFVILALAYVARAKIVDHDTSVIPDEKLSLRTFWEVFIGFFYDMMKDMMGPTRAKRYFPIVGTLACFIFFSNVLGLIPGFLPPTSTLSITAACGLVVVVTFTYYGLKEQGIGFITHLAGPWMGPLFLPINILIFAIEVVSTFIIRPVSLSIRLFLNILVDHILLGITLSIAVVLLPIPIMMLGTLVALVQVLVFCLLTSIYITLATEHHGEGHGKGHEADAAHAH